MPEICILHALSKLKLVQFIIIGLHRALINFGFYILSMRNTTQFSNPIQATVPITHNLSIRHVNASQWLASKVL